MWGINVPHLLDKSFKAIFSTLRDKHGRSLTKGQDLERIILDFYKDIYISRVNSKEPLREVLDGYSLTFTRSMNNSLVQ